MLRTRLLIVPFAGLALFGVAQAAGGPEAAILEAAAAPYRDALRQNAPALCSDLAPAAAAQLQTYAPPGGSCEQKARWVFAATAASRLPPSIGLSVRATVSDLNVTGRRATGTFTLTEEEATARPGSSTITIREAGSFHMVLEEVAGRWVVASQGRLLSIPDCRLHPRGGCEHGTNDLLFFLGVPVGMLITDLVRTPAAVTRAGGAELVEYEAGRTAVEQSGCLACHQIGETGNRGPGQNLTRVGARLTARQILKALLTPRAPMPSFRGLPTKKLGAVVRFLSLLK